MGTVAAVVVDFPAAVQAEDAGGAESYFRIFDLKRCEGLVVTGPTGTNVNDVAVLLIRGKRSDKKVNKS